MIITYGQAQSFVRLETSTRCEKFDRWRFHGVFRWKLKHTVVFSIFVSVFECCSVGNRVLLKTKYIEVSDVIEVVCERKEEDRFEFLIFLHGVRVL